MNNKIFVVSIALAIVHGSSFAQLSFNSIAVKNPVSQLSFQTIDPVAYNVFNSPLFRTNSLFKKTTFWNLENYFREEVVYYSMNNKLAHDIVSQDHSLNQYKVEKKSKSQRFSASYKLNFKFSNYLLQSDAFFIAFINDVERKRFIYDLTTKHNDIYTNEFPILEFQSVAAQQYWSGTKFWGGIGVGMVGVLMLAPKSFTKWEEGYIDNAMSNLDRAFSEPPVWDEDHWEINYIGHPYAGALYYNTIRAQGGSVFNSFLFSTIISTGWEYLYEGVAERPSIQDLIVTPVAGAILGELIHQATLGMRKNGYSVFEAVFVTVFNPMYVILNGYN